LPDAQKIRRRFQPQAARPFMMRARQRRDAPADFIAGSSVFIKGRFDGFFQKRVDKLASGRLKSFSLR
jgi:hypothetical protein